MSFTNFPEFKKLTFADKEAYEALIKDYPPISDISFQGLMGRWGFHIIPSVALLNDNLVIKYFLPEDGRNSGLSFIGTHEVDESICTIFDYLKTNGQDSRLVHVPEFVINSMAYPELFSFESERAFDEYIVSIEKLFQDADSPKSNLRERVTRFVHNADGKHVKVKSLDLSLPDNQEKLLECIDKWPKRGLNSKLPSDYEELKEVIVQAKQLDMHNVCLTVDDELHGFVLFQAPNNKEYVTLEYGMISYAMPYILNFMIYVFGEWFLEQGVKYANLGVDYGRPNLRVIKLTLAPINYFRKYTLEPVKENSLLVYTPN